MLPYWIAGLWSYKPIDICRWLRRPFWEFKITLSGLDRMKENAAQSIPQKKFPGGACRRTPLAKLHASAFGARAERLRRSDF